MGAKKSPWRDDEAHQFRIDHEKIVYCYDRTPKPMSRESQRIEEEAILPFINISKHARVLDLGCGDGRWAKILIGRCQEYTGVDSSNHYLEGARRSITSTNARFICAPAQDYCDGKRYDLIMAIGLMTYLNDEDIVKLSENCRKMLSEGGNLIVRNVSLWDKPGRRIVYDYKPNFLRRLLGTSPYQAIRRNREEELSFFQNFNLVHDEQIAGTGLAFYIFE